MNKDEVLAKLDAGEMSTEEASKLLDETQKEDRRPHAQPTRRRPQRHCRCRRFGHHVG